jgi:hypothetical protein
MTIIKFLIGVVTILIIIPLALLPACILEKIKEETICYAVYGFDTIIVLVLVAVITYYITGVVIEGLKCLYAGWHKNTDDQTVIVYV